MSYIPEYHENYYRVEGTAYNQGKIGIGTINPVQLLHVSGGNIRVDGTGFVNGDLNVSGNLNVYGSGVQFAVQQIFAEDKSIELNVATGSPIGGSGVYTTSALTDDAGADRGGITLKSTQGDKEIIYLPAHPGSGWTTNLRWILSGNYGKSGLYLSNDTTDVGIRIGSDSAPAGFVTLYRASGNVLATDDVILSTIASGKNTLSLNDTTTNVGMTLGHDTNIYRSGANVLSTDDKFGITISDGKDTLHLNNNGVDVGITIGDDIGQVTLFRSGANQLSTDDNFASTFNGGKTTLQLTNTTANVGLTIGGDANLYRSGVNVLRTDHSLGIVTNFNVDGNTILGDGNTDTVSLVGRINTNIEPSTNNSRNLGSAGLNWATIYANDITINNGLNVSGNSNLGDAYADSITFTGKVLFNTSTISGSFATTQASANIISGDKIIVTGAGVANGAIMLPTATRGAEVEIRNRAGVTINIYANSTTPTDRIYSGTTLIANGTALALPTSSGQTFICAPSGGQNIWWSEI